MVCRGEILQHKRRNEELTQQLKNFKLAREEVSLDTTRVLSLDPLPCSPPPSLPAHLLPPSLLTSSLPPCSPPPSLPAHLLPPSLLTSSLPPCSPPHSLPAHLLTPSLLTSSLPPCSPPPSLALLTSSLPQLAQRNGKLSASRAALQQQLGEVESRAEAAGEQVSVLLSRERELLQERRELHGQLDRLRLHMAQYSAG